MVASRGRQRTLFRSLKKPLPFTHTCDCGASYELREEFVGRRLSCPHCGKEFLVRDPHVQLQSVARPGHLPTPPPEPVLDEDDWQAAAPESYDNESPAAAAPPSPRRITADMLAVESLEAEQAHTAAHDGRVDFEKGMSLAPILAIVLVLTNTVIYFVTAAQGALESRESIVLAGALVRERVATGEYSRVFSSMFLHGSLDHLIGNCVALFILGMACEHAFGPIRTAVIYLAAGIGGALLSMTFSPGPSVGASGAIFGLLGAMIVFFRKHGDRFIMRDNRTGFVLLAWAGYSIFTAFFQPYIDNAGHIGGIVTGALLAFSMTPQVLTQLAGSPRTRH